MDNTRKEPESGSLPTGVFQLPGEPAIVINGVPDVSPSDSTTQVLTSSLTDSEFQGSTIRNSEFLCNAGFGDWLEGRKVQKLFGDRYYTGTVSQFDKETGWYRVVYEDGDFEDLDWHELKDFLLPLDITVSLKSLAQKILKKKQRTAHNSGKNASQSQIGKARKSKV
uniref:PTM/DIR17-like Tudor domain-containing protein n=1 Tax=Rhizophora mucronata TaxID=61149 RepID=A0A2P2PN21_RHIMU